MNRLTPPLTLAHNLRISYPEALPIVAKRAEIITAIKEHQVVIVAGETGSGKTTQIPKMCLEAGLGAHGKIGCTQPRRIAALSVSRRLADELSATWGQEIGCKIRFTDATKPDTVIKVMTDGILLAETRSDPLLRSYEALIIDEAHERSLNIDFLIGYLKRLTAKREDLKVIITSATIDTELFSKAFNNAPIFEVSGRLYPVDIRYQPLVGEEDSEGISHVDGAIRAAEEVMTETATGDLLVFMPTERDIRETCERLQGRNNRSIEVLPLMGSLSASEQERVFRLTDKRKVIVATNIAETSLTIPGIRYVIDTGLARISRYGGKQRTKRLPVEKIAQSSANQRAGRAGRVQEGICIRLYDEQDYLERPEFSEAEILRANLAEVILRMKAFKLGDIETFPFLNAPDQRAIRNGYALLQELGAIDTNNELTRLGKELAKLPVDPTIGRILLQARREHALSEVLIIAAGLSIQDPRERPVDNREAAERAHRAFYHPDSDFLTLLNIWQTYTAEWKRTKSQSQMRKFCRTNYLSYMRLREWSDLVSELQDILHIKAAEPVPASDIKRFDGRYRAIHRAILSGLLGQIAYRSDRNTYRGAGGRGLTVFPGSALVEKPIPQGSPASRSRKRSKSPAQEQWIVAAEIVETSRLFARMAARIQVSWVEELGAHICKRNCDEPLWLADYGNVMAKERVSLYGLVIASRRIPFSRYKPREAARIFIQNTLTTEFCPFNCEIIDRNRRITDKVATLLASKGKLNRLGLEERLVEFYLDRLGEISSKLEFDRIVTPILKGNDKQLEITEEYLTGGEQFAPEEASSFPNSIAIAGGAVPLRYRYEPGSDRDGITLELPLALARRIPARMLDGAIPGLRAQQVSYLLRSLPKETRRRLEPLTTCIQRVANHKLLSEKPLLEAVASVLRQDFGTLISSDLLSLEALPVHLRPRIEITDAKGEVIAGRDLSALLSAIAQDDSNTRSHELGAWNKLRDTWERSSITSWDFGDLPEALEVAKVSGVPVYLYPTLVQEDSRVALRLFDDRSAALKSAQTGVASLAQLVLSREVQDLKKQTKGVEAFSNLLLMYCSAEQMRENILQAALRHMLDSDISLPLRESDFTALLSLARSRMPNLVHSILSWTRTCLELRRALIAIKRPYQGMRNELDVLLPTDFVRATPFEHLQHLPRYLKAMVVRCERAEKDPQKDAQRTQQLVRYRDVLQKAETPPAFRWMVEEFKVSLFAQELGTQYPISAVRLDKWLATHNQKD